MNGASAQIARIKAMFTKPPMPLSPMYDMWLHDQMLRDRIEHDRENCGYCLYDSYKFRRNRFLSNPWKKGINRNV